MHTSLCLIFSVFLLYMILNSKQHIGHYYRIYSNLNKQIVLFIFKYEIPQALYFNKICANPSVCHKIQNIGWDFDRAIQFLCQWKIFHLNRLKRRPVVTRTAYQLYHKGPRCLIPVQKRKCKLTAVINFRLD